MAPEVWSASWYCTMWRHWWENMSIPPDVNIIHIVWYNMTLYYIVWFSSAVLVFAPPDLKALTTVGEPQPEEKWLVTADGHFARVNKLQNNDEFMNRISIILNDYYMWTYHKWISKWSLSSLELSSWLRFVAASIPSHLWSLEPRSKVSAWSSIKASKSLSAWQIASGRDVWNVGNNTSETEICDLHFIFLSLAILFDARKIMQPALAVIVKSFWPTVVLGSNLNKYERNVRVQCVIKFGIVWLQVIWSCCCCNKKMRQMFGSKTKARDTVAWRSAPRNKKVRRISTARKAWKEDNFTYLHFWTHPDRTKNTNRKVGSPKLDVFSCFPWEVPPPFEVTVQPMAQQSMHLSHPLSVHFRGYGTNIHP